MDFNPIELRRETIFKDAVLSAAEAKGMDIIADAQRASSEELAKAKALCEEADHDVILQSLQLDTEKEHSAALQAAKGDLLRHRTQLVDELFDDVREKLAEFTTGKDYPKWMAGRVKRHAGLAGKSKSLKILLRPADLVHKAAMLKALPGAVVAEDATIQLGGAKVSDGRVLYDETLDTALAAEREAFYKTSGLHL